MKRSKRKRERQPSEDRPRSDDTGSLDRRDSNAKKIRKLEKERKAVKAALKEERDEARKEGRKLEKERKKLKAVEAALKEERTLRVGNYYSTIDDVWTFAASNECEDPDVFYQLKRPSLPNFVTRSKSLKKATKNNEYLVTKNAAKDTTNAVAWDSSRTSTSSTTPAQTIFPTDIFGQTTVPHHQIAHVVPHSRGDATLYADAVIWAFGLDDDAPFAEIQKSIHGSKGKKGGKVHHTGLKHFVTNKVCLSCQTYFDDIPCVLIVPVMSKKKMINWKGKGYKALVMVGGSKVNGREIDSCETVDASTVCQAIGLHQRGDMATKSEIKKARKLLKHVVLGMAYWLKKCSRSFERHLSDEVNGSQSKRRKLLKESKFLLLYANKMTRS